MPITALMLSQKIAGGGGITPITFVAAGTPAGTTGFTYSPGLPAGWASGDFLLMIVESASQDSHTDGSVQLGWIAIPKSPQGTGSAAAAGAVRITAHWKFAGPGETAPSMTNSGEDHRWAQILAFRNVDPTYPFDSWDGLVTATPGTAVTMPAITTQVASVYELLLLCNATDTLTAQVSGWTNANLTSLTELADNNTNLGVGGGIGVAAGTKATAGSTGTTTATLATSSAFVGVSLGLRPVGSPPPSGTPPGSGTLANENVEFTLTAPSVVRYGGPTTYFSATFPPGTYMCGNSLFDGGDPTPFVAKTCYVP